VNPRLIGVAGKGAGLAAFVLVVAACAGASDKERAIRPVAEQPSSRLVNGVQLAVAATATGNPPRPQVALLRPNGDRVRELNLPSSGSLLSIAWSPDGRRIAFTRWLTPGWRGPSETDIFVADADGSNVRRLTRSKRADDPVWSPDGETIVFSQDEGPPASQFTGLWRVDADGGEPRELIPAEPGRVDIPSSFAPDGRALAFTRFVAPEPGAGASRPVAPAVHLLELASGEDRSLAENAADAAFSPDGRRVAFVSFRDRFRERFVDELERYGYELYVMDADGGNARRLTRTREMREQAPSWSPDGRLLA
jgi:Tol biopolymer transport system component